MKAIEIIDEDGNLIGVFNWAIPPFLPFDTQSKPDIRSLTHRAFDVYKWHNQLLNSPGKINSFIPATIFFREIFICFF